MSVTIVLFIFLFLYMIYLAGPVRLIKIIAVCIAALMGIILFFICVVKVVSLYTTRFPSLEDQLYLTVKDKCSQQPSCQVHLHELTPFKWDKAYFFLPDSQYTNQDVKRITGVNGDFQRNETLAMFLYRDKIVEYGFFALPDPVEPFERPSKEHALNMSFCIDYSRLSKIIDVDAFKTTKINYYEITPQNDLLDVKFVTFGDRDLSYATVGLMGATNPAQLHLLDQNKDKSHHQ